MLTWLLKTLGVGDELLVRLDEARLTVQRPGMLWVGLALLLPVAYLIIQRQRRNLHGSPPALRLALSATRIAILGLLVGVLSGPYLKLDYQIDKRPVVALLFDQSRSMQLPAGPFEAADEARRIARAAGYQTQGPGETGKAAAGSNDEATALKALNKIARVKLAEDVVRAGAKTLTEPLAKRFDVRYYAFAREPEALGLDPGHPAFPEASKAGASSTHIGDALARVLDDAAGRPVAGILLFSDGQNTGGRSPAEAAAASAHIGAPLFAVPTGSPTRVGDVAIVDVFTSGQVFVGDTARIAVTLESQAFDGRPVKVELRDGEKLLDTEDVTLRGSEPQKVELTFEAKEPGAKYLTVRVPPLAEEPEHLRGNNEDVAFVRVSDEKLRVLLVDGLPRWDFRFLKNAMRRDKGLAGRASNATEPDVVLESEVRRRPAEARASALPGSVKDLADYHAVILGDVSPALVDSRFVTMLAEAVRDQGLGVIVAAGPRHMPAAFDDRFHELLPVRLRRGAEGIDAPVYKPFTLELSVEGSVHEVMRLYDDPGRNGNAWSQMPPYFWCAAVERPAPAATTLAWNPGVRGRFGKLPLVTQHYAGRGKVLFVATDSTWLWRRNVGDRFFYKFWGQAIRAVARRDDALAKKSWLEVRPVRAQPGEEGQVEVMAIGADGAPRTDRTLTVQLTGQGAASTIEVTADPATKGRYTGKFTLKDPGEYRLAYEPGGGAAAVEAKIRVMDAPEELRHPNVNRPALELLARAADGRLVELPDLATIPAELKGESKTIQVHREATLWDNWLVLAVLMTIYAFDVALRRLAGLS
jgi:hypothetical protein